MFAAMAVKPLRVFLVAIMVTAQCLACESSNSMESMEVEADGKIFFPGQIQEVRVSSRSQSKCVGNFCEDLENYPQEYIDKLVVNQPMLKEFFSADVVPPVEIAERGQFDDLEETLCESSIRTIAPKTGVNTNNETRLIVQTGMDKQLITTEVCNERATCKFKEMFPNDYQVYCKQKYMRRRLFSIDQQKSNETTPFIDVYDIPCCCVCAIKKKNT